MRILGIETSFDETSASIIESTNQNSKVTLLSHVIASSLPLHDKTGGVIPETAAREQIKYIIPVIQQALEEVRIRHSGLGLKTRPEGLSKISKRSWSRVAPQDDDIIGIDAIAVTYGPGLIGSLLVGVETAKTLSYVWNKPLIPVNHLIGHIYANFITLSPSTQNPVFPALALIVSGGHTDLVLLKDHGDITWLGGTRDDAAGEAFDKIGRLLGLPYPAGSVIEKLARKGDPKAYHFPRPIIASHDFDFSFSGLKAAVMREVKTIEQLNNETINNLAASVQAAIIDVLVHKTITAAEQYNVKSILLGGGVAANELLRKSFTVHGSRFTVIAPPPKLCTDNAAMIAAAAFYNYKEVSWRTLTADPELYFD